MFSKVFWLTLFPDFPGLLLVFGEIMPDKVTLDHKKSYLVYYENSHFLWFLHLWPIFAKNRKKLKFSKLNKYDFLWPKMTLSDIISTKNSKSPWKSREVRTAFWRTLIFNRFMAKNWRKKKKFNLKKYAKISMKVGIRAMKNSCNLDMGYGIFINEVVPGI